MKKPFLITIILCLLLAFTACVPSQPVAEDSPSTDMPNSTQTVPEDSANPQSSTEPTAHNEQENKPTESPQPTPIDEDKYFKLGSLTIPKAITELDLNCNDEAYGGTGTTLVECGYEYQGQFYHNNLNKHYSLFRGDFIRNFTLDMIPFDELDSLEQLFLAGYTGSVQILNKCPSLTKLGMDRCGISQFASIDHLTHLSLNRCQGIDWSIIANAPHLETLNMFYNFPEDFGIISGIQNLKGVAIGVPYDPEYRGQLFVTLTKDSFVFDPPKTFPYSEEEVRMLVFEKGVTVLIIHNGPDPL